MIDQMDEPKADVVNEQRDALASVHTESFPELLSSLGISVAVSTYQAGRLLFLRADQGVLNTHFRQFRRPMGVAVQSGRLWVGTACEVWEFHNSRQIAASIEPEGKHDCCYMPRHIHITGDIAIHEMAFARDELWIVNTRFSCLCTLDHYHSFRPKWQPPFITELASEDRCHLNGLAMKDGAPAFVTVLGQTNEARGWRENKRDGGAVLAVPSGNVVIDKLAMPHSPRWHDGKLWLLESGTGSFGTVDLKRGVYEPIVHLPGFTRGLDFFGPYAFVGLSQVRETATFSGLPITESDERCSGVWVVDIKRGQTVAFLRFDGSVQEIFAVQILASCTNPELVMDDNPLMANAFVLPD